ncbi:MAG: RluA family pseudouridine synthase [Pseudomonadota bacterium]
MNGPGDIEWEEDDAPAQGSSAEAPYAELEVTEALAGERLDKALARLAEGIPGLSRSRIAEALAAGRVTDPQGKAPAPKTRAAVGQVWRIALPALTDPVPQPQAIPLDVVYEDASLIVVDKPAGMVVHPAPGSPDGTLVNALLHHCGDSLSGIGGERRPGIVHRIDKDTSGLLVVAKTEAAHAGLAQQFAAHSIERAYAAILWGVPDTADPRLMGLEAVTAEGPGQLRIEAPIARHPSDRKRMAVRHAGRHAVTRLGVEEVFRAGSRPWAVLARCRLETGRTHQIRVHAAHIGHPLVGDPVYGSGRRRPPAEAAEAGEAALGFQRQALHAQTLGFTHPVTGDVIAFESPLPEDFTGLLTDLRRDA